MKHIVTLILLAACLSGCVKMTGFEHSIYGSMTRTHDGGEVYAMEPSGHQNQGGSWSAGTKLKTIWIVK